MRGTWILAAAFAAVVLLAAPARASIDAEVPAAFKATGSLDPGEVETYRFRASRNMSFSLAVAAGKKTSLSPEAVLFDEEGSAVAIPNAFIAITPTRVTVKNFTLGSSGLYRIEVSGEGSGDYTVSMKTVPAKSWTGTLTFSGAGNQTFDFAAPPGSGFKAVARQAQGSAAVPRFTIYREDSGDTGLPPQFGTFTPTSHTVVITGSGGGNLAFVVGNAGGDGAVSVTVTMLKSKAKPAKFDFRGPALGRPGGGGTFVSSFVGESGGTVTVEDEDSDIAGASVALPFGAVDRATSVTLASADVPPVPDEDDQPAGPAVDLGPSGHHFQMQVTVTLPFDLALLPADAGPEDLRILIVEDDGSSREVEPNSIDEGAGLLTTSTSDFSVCIPIVRRGTPRLGVDPGGDEYWFVGLHGSLQPGPGNDSRNRSLSIQEGVISFFGDNSIQFAGAEASYSWSNDEDGSGGIDPFFQADTDSDSGSATWSYGSDGQTLQVSTGDTSPPALVVSRDGDVMASRPEDGADTETECLFLFRKPQAAPTLAAAAGTYQGVGFEINADEFSGGGDPVPFQLGRITCTLVLGADGSARLSYSQRSAAYDSGAWSTSSEKGSLPEGTFTVEAGGTLLAAFPGDEPETFRFRPCRDMKGLLATRGAFDEGSGLLLLFAREGTGFSAADVDGTWRGALFDADMQEYQAGNPPSIQVPDVSIRAEGVKGTFTGGASGTLDFHDHRVARNDGTAGGVEVAEEDNSLAVGVSVASKGKVSLGTSEGGAAGFLSPDGGFMVLTSDLADADGSFFTGILVRSPPLRLP